MYGYQPQGDPSQQPPPEDTGAPPPPQGPGAAAAGGKKTRSYATQQYDFAQGANSTLGGAAHGGYPPDQGYGLGAGYQAGAPAPAPSYDPGPTYGQTQPQPQFQPLLQQQQQQQQPQQYGQPAMYGQPTTPGYAAPDMGGLTGQMGGMSLGGQPAYGQPAQGGPPSSFLQTIDLMQPFNVAELDHPPPAINLPPNSAATPSPNSNCPPTYMRSTINAVPHSHNLLKKSKLPFALVIQPYTSLTDAESPVPLVTDTVISRCRRCRSYINPYVSFLDHGHRWRCNMCNLTNDVPQAFDWDHVNQKQADRWQRAELNHAVVEFVAPQEYMVRPPQPLVYLFLLDVSYAAVTSGLLATAARTILESLDRIPNEDKRTRLGFICVDSALHYFSINAETNEPAMLVVSDLEEPFLPVPTDLLVSLSACREGIETLLSKLQDMYSTSTNSASCMGSALKAGHKLISSIGGKMVVLTATLPNLGAGKLDMREDKKLLGTSKESSLLQTGNAFYKSFAVECSKSQVSVDMFLFSSSYQDVASLSNLPRYTGGQTYFYPGWSAARSEDAIKFAKEFSDHLSAEIALEAVMRVRATTGLRMSTFYGNFFNRSSDLCAFPAFPRDQGYVVEVAIDETLTKNFVCFQTAVLHTTCNGERRIRVMTLSLPTTGSLSEIYASADPIAITTFYSHRAVEKALSSSLESAREALYTKLQELLICYKKELQGTHSGMSAGISFCSNLKSLPILFLALSKHVGLRKSAQIPSDLRSSALCLLSTLPAKLLMQYIHPKMYSLHDMSDECGLPHPETGEIVLPQPINLSSERLQSYGLYLIDDTQNQFLWVGRDAMPELIQDVFGLPSAEHVKVGKTTLQAVDNEFNEKVRNVIEKSRSHKGQMVGSITVPNFYVVKADGEPSLRLWAQTLLVEDRSDGGPGMGLWMTGLREKVNQS
ncbi:COPII subunit [Orbilia oligospora]|uniref:Protein transport protein SEC24 n=1 Tax=Orbilia oligospora TaxID=2813651 RepID=A0A7C8VIW0_ORBOL|nr:COPII subunit [Orbilia oligospora]